MNGELEDYYWQFGPTAITLSDFGGRMGSSSTMALPASTGLAVLLGLLLRRSRRSRKH